MTGNELRRMFVEFFKERGHKEIASASLLPDNDPSVLFTTAGMHPLVPYLLGEKHPLGKRLVNIQKCVRTGDIDEVGDDTHLTFFEMLGNWSFGDYFKKEAINYSIEFLTVKLCIPMEKLAVTVFEGDELVHKDVETYKTFKHLGFNDHQIFYYGRKENWWGPAGQTGPCGPDTEIFFNTGKEKCCDDCGPACHCGKYVEIWNNVFMEYNKNEDGSFSKLNQTNVDTGMGLERILMVMERKENVYDTELFLPIISKLECLTGSTYSKNNAKIYHIICDHMRAATFILGDNKAIIPSNTEQGYILRRILRRVIRMIKNLGVNNNILPYLAEEFIHVYGSIYPELINHKTFILEQIEREYELFAKTLNSGLKRAEKYFNNIFEDRALRSDKKLSGEKVISSDKVLSCDKVLSSHKVLSGEIAFHLYDTYGFPIELTAELAKEKGLLIDIDGFRQKYKEHQEKSRTGSEGMFKGGLADYSEQTTKLHTATHLLLGALRKVLGNDIYQRGSNINSKRLRFDFSFERKMTVEELNEVCSIVNEAIEKAIDVTWEELTVDEAKTSGAIGVFDKKYGELVKVYTIDDYSKEICGGPHVKNTRELGEFIILKEESSSTGIRRIKAVVS